MRRDVYVLSPHYAFILFTLCKNRTGHMKGSETDNPAESRMKLLSENINERSCVMLTHAIKSSYLFEGH
jgi:hypothetical protein